MEHELETGVTGLCIILEHLSEADPLSIRALNSIFERVPGSLPACYILDVAGGWVHPCLRLGNGGGETTISFVASSLASVDRKLV